MKFTLLFCLLLCLAVDAFAVDFSTINNESVTVFLNLFPEYRAIATKYGEEINQLNAIPKSQEFASQLSQLFAKWNISNEEFAKLTQKISMGLFSAQMESSGMPMEMGGVGQMMGGPLAEEEVNVIKTYMTQLQQVFEAE